MSKLKCISGSTLKIIAVITMFVDHFGKTVLIAILQSPFMREQLPLQLRRGIHFVYRHNICYYIGRLSFPIFCFLIVEGFVHTSNVKKYVMRLAAFALISEIAADITLNGGAFYYQKQGVFFTLTLGLVTIWGLRELRGRGFLRLVCVGCTLACAYLLRCDYGYYGVAMIALIYLLREEKVLQLTLCAAGCLPYQTAPLAYIPIAMYNGERGLRLKYFFYVFYPVHLLLLHLISLGIGLL